MSATPKQPSDADLVARALAGERWAEDVIFRRHAPRVSALSDRLLRRHADADDVVQDTFVRVFDRLSQLRDPLALAAWIDRIAVNLVRRRLRLQTMRSWIGLSQDGDGAEPALRARADTRPDLRLELRALEAIVQRQPIERRLAWMLHRVQGMSLRETAETTTRSLATIKRYVAAVDSELGRHRPVPERPEPAGEQEHPHG